MARKKNIETENIVLAADDLRAKYGDTKVGVVKRTPMIEGALPKTAFAAPHSCMCVDLVGVTRLYSPLSYCAAQLMEYIPRHEAEISPDYLQPIGYSVITCDDSIFATKRISGGDKRLNGLYSIGIGGHVDEGETFTESIYRELEEEVGVTGDMIFTKKMVGYIYSAATEVNKVHLGVVYNIILLPSAKSVVRVQETDRLDGEWITLQRAKNLAEKGEMESWSAMLLEVDGLIGSMLRESREEGVM